MSKLYALALPLLAAGSIHAQSTESLRVNVPFEFVVGGTTLPAGNYVIQQSGQPTVVTLHGTKAGAIVSIAGGAEAAAAAPGLVFVQENGARRLAKIRTAADELLVAPSH